MFDLSKPVTWQVVVGTILAICAAVIVGIALLKMKKRRED